MSASIWKPGEGTISVDAESTNLEQVFTTASAQTLFTLTAFEYAVGTGSLAVYRNGQRLVLGVDWEETSSTSFTLLVAVVAGETIVANGIIGSSGASAAAAAASAASAAASAEAAALFDPSSYATKAFPVFSGYIRGDFSNATLANRVLFQTSTANAQSYIGVIPNGTATQSGVIAYNAADPTNASYATLICNATEASIRSGYGGTGSFVPFTVHVGGAERLRIGINGHLGVGVVPNASWGTSIKALQLDTLASLYQLGSSSIFANNLYNDGTNARFLTTGRACGISIANGNFDWFSFSSGVAGDIVGTSVSTFSITNTGDAVLKTPNGGLGYGSGAGGTVTQVTSRSTAVTLNKPCGKITMFTAAGSTTWNNFVVNNSLVTADDTILISYAGSISNSYTFQTSTSAGSFTVRFVANGTSSDTPVLNFTVIKGASS